MFENFIGLVLGERYEIQARLGSGGMALVFAAHDRHLDCRVAVKIIKPEFAWSSDVVDAFIKETRIIANLQHPHILTVYDYGTQNISGQELTYLVMRLAGGGTLLEWLERRPLALTEAERILKQVCSALDYAHSHRVVHLDLKPANILFDERRNVLVADFGLARLFHATSHVTTQNVAGTPSYMPPEQRRGKATGPLSDVYALGITLYQALTGELPERELREESLLVHLRQPLPPGIRAVIERATQSDPSRRYHTAGELAQAFTAAAASSTPASPWSDTKVHEGEPALHPPEEREKVLPASKSPSLKRSWIPLAGAGLTVLIVIASLVLLGPRWLEEQVKNMLVALSLTLTPSPTVTATPTATLSPSPAPTPSPTITLTPTPAPMPYIIVPTERLRVYAGPDENHDVVGEVYRGDQLPLCGRSADGTWWQVDYLGRKGWVRAQPVGASVEPTVLPAVKAPPTPVRTPTPTDKATPGPRPNTVLRLQNPGFEGIQENLIPGWFWQAVDNYSAGEDPSSTFDTPSLLQTNDPARMINGPTLQIEESFLRFKVHVFQTVSAPPTAIVRFQAWAKAYSDLGGVRLAAGIDPNGGRDCSQARWGEVLTVDQSSGIVQLVAPDVAVGPVGRVTVCLYAETPYSAPSHAAFFDDAALIANPE